jgi:prepilin-type N-terminal cleavage/methylation domain-containing protein
MRERGFSLIELLIVVAIILVLAAIAIPSMLRAKIQANEASAVSSIRAINTAQVTYAVNYPTEGYADNLAKLGAPTSGPVSSTNAGLLDWVLGCATQPCTKSGYQFAISASAGNPVSAYSVVGTPSSPGNSGIRGFCSFQMNPVMYDPAGGTACTATMQ